MHLSICGKCKISHKRPLNTLASKRVAPLVLSRLGTPHMQMKCLIALYISLAPFFLSFAIHCHCHCHCRSYHCMTRPCKGGSPPAPRALSPLSCYLTSSSICIVWISHPFSGCLLSWWVSNDNPGHSWSGYWLHSVTVGWLEDPFDASAWRD